MCGFILALSEKNPPTLVVVRRISSMIRDGAEKTLVKDLQLINTLSICTRDGRDKPRTTAPVQIHCHGSEILSARTDTHTHTQNRVIRQL